MCWLVESKSVRWRFPVSYARQSQCSFPVTTVFLPFCKERWQFVVRARISLQGPTRRQMCGGRWALLWRCVCVCVHVCHLSGCEAQVHIDSIAEIAAVYIVRHCRCVVSWCVCMTVVLKLSDRKVIIDNCLCHLSRKNTKHSLFPASKIWEFSALLFFITVNWIPLVFRNLDGCDKLCEDITLAFGKSKCAFFPIFWHFID